MNDASALKNETGEIQVPFKAENLLQCIIIHCNELGRDPEDIVQDINDATSFWLRNNDLLKQRNAVQYTRGLN